VTAEASRLLNSVPSSAMPFAMPTSLILGVVVSRYVLPGGRLAEADADALTAWLGDQLQPILDGPAPPPLSRAPG
jgi:hypothetical protein